MVGIGLHKESVPDCGKPVRGDEPADREPDNQVASEWAEKLKQTHDPHEAVVTTLGEEAQFNPFFRLDNRAILEKLKQEFPDLNTDSQQDVFMALRKCRDQW